MEKGYYKNIIELPMPDNMVAIHNKNGKGLLLDDCENTSFEEFLSQSTIKMEKGYY